MGERHALLRCPRFGTVQRPDFHFSKVSCFQSAIFSGSFDFLIFTLIFEFVLATRARVPTARLTRARVGSKIYEKHKNFGHVGIALLAFYFNFDRRLKILPEGDYEYPASSGSENVKPQISVFVGRSFTSELLLPITVDR